MAESAYSQTLSLLQDTLLQYVVRQGVRFTIDIEWLDETETPVDISDMTFLSQIRTAYAADAGSTVVVNFTETPDGEGNFVDIDIPTARTTFTVSEETAEGLTADATYYFESKMVDNNGEAIDSIQATIVARKDIARIP